MIDRIIHMAVSGDDIFGLSEMGNIYQMRYGNEQFYWDLVIKSPEVS